MKRMIAFVVLAIAVSLGVAACGGDDDSGSSRARREFKVPDIPVKTSSRRGRGRAQPGRLGRLRRGRLDRPEASTGSRRSRRRPAARSTSRSASTSDEMVHADAHRPVRRRLGLGQRDRAADRRRRRRPGQHRPDPHELRRHRSRAQEPALQHGRRPDVRHPARLGREPADVAAPTRSSPAPTSLGRGLRPEDSAVQGQDHRVRRPDLHRRRGALPEGDAAGPGDHEPVRARRRRSSTPRSTC